MISFFPKNINIVGNSSDYDDDTNQSYNDFFRDSSITNSLFPLTIIENEPLLNIRNDFKTSNETHQDQRINSTSERNDEIKNDNINESKEENINNNIMLNKKRKLGRRSKEEKENQINDVANNNYHDKYRNDNLLKKIKHISIYSCFNFINEILKKIYNTFPKQKKFEHQLITLKHLIIKETKVEINKFVLDNTMKWILSQKISSKFKKYDPNHNKTLLEKSPLICNEEDKNKLELLLNMKYIDYLDFYRGNKPEYNQIFEGLVTFEQYCQSDDFLKNNPDYENYKKELENYLNNYENKLNEIKGRKSKKSKNKEIINELLNINEI